MSDFIIGLTGGVASGKSEVTRRFEALGVHVADADVIARAVVEPGQPALAAIVARFGAEVLLDDGRLDRRRLREHVFAEPQARRELEAITHPAIRAALRAECRAAPGPYAIAAIPLLAEALPLPGMSGGGREAYPWLQRVLVVDVPVAVQHARLLARDGIDEGLAERMIAAQATRAQRLAIADDVIVNDGAVDALQPHVEALDALYRALARVSG